ncbi:hypothetical protein Hanom_Chr08g00696391 [Helianthus anomalus]
MEAWLSELRSSMITLQKEAISAMLSVEEQQQQQITLQKLLMIVILYTTKIKIMIILLESLNVDEYVIVRQVPLCCYVWY